MKRALSFLLLLLLLAVPLGALAQGSGATALPSPLPGADGTKPDVLLYVLISLFPLAAVVVGVFWVIRFKEKHIDGK